MKMMKTILRNKYILIALLLCVISIFSFAIVKLNGFSDEREGDFVIVTSFYPMYIATINLTDGIENVKVENLTNNVAGCLHDYQLSTKDLKMLDKANMLVMNGAGMEEFLSDVPEQFENLKIVTATDGLTLLSEDDEYNSHSWMDVYLYKQEIENIAEGLIQMDSANEDKYRDNLKRYEDELDELIQEIEVINNSTRGEKVVTFHDAFVYLENMFSVEVEAAIDMDEDTALSAAEVGEIVDLVKSGDIEYLISDEENGKSTAEAINEETNAEIIYLNPLVSGESQKDAYIKGMKANIEIIKGAFTNAK